MLLGLQLEPRRCGMTILAVTLGLERAKNNEDISPGK